MSTLLDLKSRISRDIDDFDDQYASDIADAIVSAVAESNIERFYFNETNDIEFATVAAQEWYGTTDEALIPKLIKIDAVFSEDAGGTRSWLGNIDPAEIEILNDNSASTGEPSGYSFYRQQIRLNPIPDSANYTIIVQAHYFLDAPANDADENAWTNDAFQLIRARATIDLATNTVHDADLKARAETWEARSLTALRRRTSKMNGTGVIAPMWF